MCERGAQSGGTYGSRLGLLKQLGVNIWIDLNFFNFRKPCILAVAGHLGLASQMDSGKVLPVTVVKHLLGGSIHAQGLRGAAQDSSRLRVNKPAYLGSVRVHVHNLRIRTPTFAVPAAVNVNLGSSACWATKIGSRLISFSISRFCDGGMSRAPCAAATNAGGGRGNHCHLAVRRQQLSPELVGIYGDSIHVKRHFTLRSLCQHVPFSENGMH